MTSSTSTQPVQGWDEQTSDRTLPPVYEHGQRDPLPAVSSTSSTPAPVPSPSIRLFDESGNQSCWIRRETFLWRHGLPSLLAGSPPTHDDGGCCGDDTDTSTALVLASNPPSPRRSLGRQVDGRWSMVAGGNIRGLPCMHTCQKGHERSTAVGQTGSVEHV